MFTLSKIIKTGFHLMLCVKHEKYTILDRVYVNIYSRMYTDRSNLSLSCCTLAIMPLACERPQSFHCQSQSITGASAYLWISSQSSTIRLGEPSCHIGQGEDFIKTVEKSRSHRHICLEDVEDPTG